MPDNKALPSEIELTPRLLHELETLAQAATPGPWEYNGAYALARLPDETELRSLAKQRQGANIINVNRAFGPDACQANAAYIAAANPAVILALLAELKRLTSAEHFAGQFLALAKAQGYKPALATMTADAG